MLFFFWQIAKEKRIKYARAEESKDSVRLPIFSAASGTRSVFVLLQEILEEVENVRASSKDLRRTSEGACALDYVLIPVIKNKGCFVDEV